MEEGLPFQAEAHDSFRQGLPTLHEDIQLRHPVEAVQQRRGPVDPAKLRMMRELYGIAAPAKMQIECQILDRFQRLGGLPSSKLGLESLTGALDDFSFESYLGLPENSDTPEPDLHSQMESKLHMNTKPMARGII